MYSSYQAFGCFESAKTFSNNASIERQIIVKQPAGKHVELGCPYLWLMPIYCRYMRVQVLPTSMLATCVTCACHVASILRIAIEAWYWLKHVLHVHVMCDLITSWLKCGTMIANSLCCICTYTLVLLNNYILTQL